MPTGSTPSSRTCCISPGWARGRSPTSNRKSSSGSSSGPWPRSGHAIRTGSIEVVGTPPVIVDADETYLGLLLENLLANAVKYSPPDTLIEVRLTELDGDEI